MEPDFWHRRWADNQIGFHEGRPNALLERHFGALGLAPGAGVFVPLCGKAVDLAWLAAHGHPVVGVELSGLACAAFFAEQGLVPARETDGPFTRWRAGDITLLEGDCFDLEPEHLGDCAAIYDRAALIALPPGLRGRYTEQLAALLPRAPRLLVTLEYPQNRMEGPPFSVEADEVSTRFGAYYRIECLERHDVLEDNPRFREAGLDRLTQCAWRLIPRCGAC